MIYHVAAHKADNAGDIVILDATAKLLSEYGHEIIKVDDYKGRASYDDADAVIVGGGGLFIRDTKPNNVSGWRWKIAPEQLSAIKPPVIVWAVGFNQFRRQEEYAPQFADSLRALVDKAAFFGIREHASIRRLRHYIGDRTLSIEWMPCPASAGKHVYPDIAQRVPEVNSLVFAPAMDRLHLRGDIKRVIPSLRAVVRAGWQLTVATHIAADLDILPLLDGIHYRHVELRDKPAREILKLYADAGAVIGMRLHSCLIPFGFERPVIPVISHDKLKDWLTDISHPEWGVELSDPLIDDEIVKRLDNPQTDPLAVEYCWWMIRDNMREIESIITCMKR